MTLVDSIVADYYRHFAQDIEASSDALWKQHCRRDFHNYPQMEAKRTYASADGQLDLEILSDGSTSPEHGCDTPMGSLAVLCQCYEN